eukprot:g29269.t1
METSAWMESLSGWSDTTLRELCDMARVHSSFLRHVATGLFGGSLLLGVSSTRPCVYMQAQDTKKRHQAPITKEQVKILCLYPFELEQKQASKEELSKAVQECKEKLPRLEPHEQTEILALWGETERKAYQDAKQACIKAMDLERAKEAKEAVDEAYDLCVKLHGELTQKSADELDDFLGHYGYEHSQEKSEKRDQGAFPGLHRLVGTAVQDVVFNSAADVLVVFGAAWCPHSTTMTALLEQVAYALEETPGVIVATMDGEKNVVRGLLQPHEQNLFPLLKMFPKAKRDQPVIIEEASAAGIIKALWKHRSTEWELDPVLARSEEVKARVQKRVGGLIEKSLDESLPAVHKFRPCATEFAQLVKWTVMFRHDLVIDDGHAFREYEQCLQTKAAQEMGYWRQVRATAEMMIQEAIETRQMQEKDAMQSDVTNSIQIQVMKPWLAKLEDARHIADVSPVYGEDPHPIGIFRFVRANN